MNEIKTHYTPDKEAESFYESFELEPGQKLRKGSQVKYTLGAGVLKAVAKLAAIKKSQYQYPEDLFKYLCNECVKFREETRQHHGLPATPKHFTTIFEAFFKDGVNYDALIDRQENIVSRRFW